MATDEIKQVIKIEASLTKIQSDLKTLEGNFASSFGKISSVASSALGTLGIGLSVGALAGFLKHVIDVGDQLSDLSDQTGLSIQVLGGIKPVLEANNSSLDGFAKGIAKVQRSLGDIEGDGKAAAQAFAAIGLSAKELANLSPDQFLERFVNALAKIENRNERAAIAQRAFGRSAAELIPTLLTLADTGITRLDDATAQAFKTLGAFKDQLVQIGATIVNVVAPPLAGFIELLKILHVVGRSPLENLTKSVSDARAEIDKLDKQIAAISNSPPTRAGRTEQLAGLNQQRNEALQKFIDLNSKLIQQDQLKPGSGIFKGLLKGTEDLKNAKSEVDNFLEGLQKQLATLEGKKIEVTFGADIALSKSLDAQFEQFKENLRAKNIPIPKGLAEFFVLLRDKIVGSNSALTELNESLERGIALREAFAKDANESVGIKVLNKDDVARDFQKLEALRHQVEELRKSLAIEMLPEDQQGNARIIQDVEERIKVINEWRDAEIASGKDVAQINEEAAQLSAQAWIAAGQKMKESVDETTEFTRRAFERAFDAVADAITDVLDNGFKSWTDFGEKIRKTLNKLAADFLTLQAKEALFGKEFGKAGGAIGGIIGDLFGTKKTPGSPLDVGGKAADTLDAERGQQLAALAQTAITTGATIAETTITTLGATTQTAILALQAEAIVAIQAAAAGNAASSNAPGLLGALGSLFNKTPLDAGPASQGGGLLAMGYHEGGPITAPRMHSGGDVPLWGQAGEFMMKRWSAARIGAPTLNYMNEFGKIPASASAGRGGGAAVYNNSFNFHGVTDADSFRRSRSQILADLSRAVQKGNKHR